MQGELLQVKHYQVGVRSVTTRLVKPHAVHSASLAHFSAGAIIMFGGLPMSGMDHSATVEQAEELVQLCRQGRLYQLDKCRKASGVAP